MPLDPLALAALLEHGDLHEIGREADALRTERFARTVTYAALDHVDPPGAHAWCPICGEEAPALGFARRAGPTHPRATDIHVLPGGASADALLSLLARLMGPGVRPAAVPAGAGATGLRPTVQLGTSGDLAAAAESSAMDLTAPLAGLGERGLRQASDGVRPTLHPAHGGDASRRWEQFWRSAAAAGLRGHTVVLYGPDHPRDDVVHQIEAIGTLQTELGVFASVAPVIHAAVGFQGARDALLTQGNQDLRMLAACRLGLPQVPHVRVSYNRSDLKLAHISLACGADDLDGHLELGERDVFADADAFDLSLREMPLWLREAGFTPTLRNGLYEPIAAEGPSPSSSSRGDADHG